MNNLEALQAHIAEEEGLKLVAYMDTLGKYHIGYGHLLDQDQTDAELEIMGLEEERESWEGFTITEEQAKELRDVDIQEAVESLAPTFEERDLEMLTPDRYIAIISMSFQMGGFGIQKRFPAFCKAVHDEDWDRAADEMMWRDGLKKQKHSLWYTQTPHRCQRMADAMRTGSFGDKPSDTTSDSQQLLNELERIISKLKNILNT